MSNIRALDIDLLDDLFDMRGGYVLDFTDRTFGEFFRRELRINIDEPRWTANGTSKAKRLRYLLQTMEDATAVRVIVQLWEYREAKRKRAGQQETIPDAQQEFWALVVRLGGKGPGTATAAGPKRSGPDRQRLTTLAGEWLELSKLKPHERGFEFERFLRSLFDAYGLDPRSSFRNVGEQIDGSFQLNGFTYLVEARWREAVTDAAALHSFHGKLDQKAEWSRGLFLSMAGFSSVGLTAFGRAKKVICMDGYDLYETLNQGHPLDEVIERKVRRAAETGMPFVSIRELL